MNAEGQGIGLLSAAAAMFVAGCGAGAESTRAEPRCVLDVHPELGKMPACPRGTELTTRCEPSVVLQWCEMPDGTRHGAWRRIFVDDRGLVDRETGSFRNGRRHGVWTWQARNGFRTRAEYRDGLAHGVATESFRGRKTEESHYENGYREGRRTLWDRNGKMRTDIEEFRGCTTKALDTLQFPRTKAGFRFGYSYVLRPEMAAARTSP